MMCVFPINFFFAPAPETCWRADDLSDVSVQCFSHICCFLCAYSTKVRSGGSFLDIAGGESAQDRHPINF